MPNPIRSAATAATKSVDTGEACGTHTLGTTCTASTQATDATIAAGLRPRVGVDTTTTTTAVGNGGTRDR